MARAITTKYLSATNTKGSRIKVTSYYSSKTYSYDYAAKCPHTAAAEQYVKEEMEYGTALGEGAELPNSDGQKVFFIK